MLITDLPPSPSDRAAPPGGSPGTRIGSGRWRVSGTLRLDDIKADLLRGLETNYSRIVAEKTLSRYGFGNIWKTIQEDYNLWGDPFHDLCRKAAQVQIQDFLKGPSEGQTVGVDDLMARCFHLFVMNRHDSLFVVDGDRIVGLLRFSDVYREVVREMKECRIDSVPK